MSTGYQVRDQSGTHFVTFTVVDWVDVFSRKRYRDILIESLAFCISNKNLQVFAYVIMSNHIHLIVRSTTNNLSGTIRDFKRFTALKIIEAISAEPESRCEWMLHRFSWNGHINQRNTINQFWQQDNRPMDIFSQAFFLQKLNYIHENPVRAGIVDKPEDYIYSSARTLLTGSVGLLPITEWWLPV